MKTPFAAAVLALLALAPSSAPVGAQVFAGEAALDQELAGFRAQAAALRSAAKAAPAPKTRRTPHRMGRHGFSAQSLPPAGANPAPAVAPDVSKYPVRGIDVSHYEGAIDWTALQTAGLSFVYIKATDGTDIVDEQFARNWQGAADAGLARGAYHFYDFCDGGGVQADLFIQTVPVDAHSLPPTIDLEKSKECAKMPAKDPFRRSLAAFVAKIRAAYGRDPILYVNAGIYDAYFAGEGDDYKLWIADVRHAAPDFSAPWTLWQYGWHGHVPGIAGEVDLDVFNGTPQALAALDGDATGVRLASAR